MVIEAVSRGAVRIDGQCGCRRADPYTGECHLFTQPGAGDYQSELTGTFDKPLDLTGTVDGLKPETADFPGD